MIGAQNRVTDPKLELTALVSMMDSPDPVRSHLLSNISEDHFGNDVTKSVYNRIQLSLTAGDSAPSVFSILGDPALTNEAKKLLKAGLPKKSKGGKTLAHRDSVKLVREAQKVVKNLEHYRITRHIYSIAETAANSIKDGNAGKDTIANIEAELASIQRGDLQEEPVIRAGDGDDHLFSQIIGEAAVDDGEIIKSGFKAYDNINGGFAKGNVTFLVSNYGGGKSVMGMQLGLNAYANGHSVLIISLEMSARKMWSRIWSNKARVNYSNVWNRTLKPKQVNKIKRARKAFQKHGKKHDCRFDIWCPAILEPWSLVRKFKDSHYDMIIIDYISLVEKPADGSSNEERIRLGEIAAVFKKISKPSFLDCAIVTMAQLNDEDKIKYAKAMSEHADNVWWWRRGETEQETDEQMVNQDKARDGEMFGFPIRTELRYMTMRDVTSDEREDYDDQKDETTQLKKAIMPGLKGGV